MAEEESNFLEEEDQRETEEDIVDLDQSQFSSAVVSGNDWTTETLINQINKGNILLNPDFQRRDAWDKKRKSLFVESLILGLPVPQLVLAESKERRGSYIVLDGKQRMLSIRQFAAREDDPDYEQLKLTGLEIREDLKGKTLSSLQEDIALYDDLSAFENQPIRTVVIKNWPNEDFLYHVFLRLNTGSVSLSPQELRQALHPGPFVTFLDRSSSESSALREILNLKKPDFRMRDAELLLRYYAFKNYLEEYTGNLKKFLDATCKKLNAAWDTQEKTLFGQLDEFEQAHQSLKTIFGENLYRKWNGQSYERRFNRAVFDVLILAFARQDVRMAAAGHEAQIQGAFQELCENNRAFMNSIETTTKSTRATQIRISGWNEKLNKLLGTNLPLPRLLDAGTP
ncbi:DUF262 domain-containing protein [Ectothiorhodospira marina]|uniref:GmrSD restriction endonucleases N-terminal domain-containing protein n=1 Tax=Ectothiorhodospira marina TaxID=1396821 RepID=A0A1H7K6B0_9GAMM|nr:DUF262 domain-containing protein [Ectothiorhodospira marina]SEK82398.1 Protein of unknown function DUF262 [Ectothiorhodospira marina]